MAQKFFGWGMRINLEWIVQFHNECNRLMGNRVFEINQELESCNDTDREFELIYEKRIYGTTFDRMLLVNTFLMMYSFLEEFMYHIWKRFSNGASLDQKKGSITRFRNVFKKSFGMDLAKDSDWQFIVCCEKIRDCLLHANGRIDLSKDESVLRKIIASSNGLLESDLERIILKREFIVKVNHVLNSFIEKIESKESI
jgi:hypothetical protein